jgi:hypothetical protein
MLAHAGARAGRPGCAEVLELLQAVQQSEISVSTISRAMVDAEPFAEDLDYQYWGDEVE